MSAPRYRERLTVPWWWWPMGLLVAVIAALEFPPQLPGSWLAVIYAGIGLVTFGFLARVGATVVRVDDAELRAGQARIELRYLAEAHVLDERDTRRWLGPQADPTAFLVTRWWIHRSVLVVLDDPADDTPYWLLSSRRPEQLAAALSERTAAIRIPPAPVEAHHRSTGG